MSLANVAAVDLAALAGVDGASGEVAPGERPSLLTLWPGRITELNGEVGLGLTRLGLRLLAEPSRRSLVVAVDVRGWLSPLAAWETGVEPGRLVVVRCPDPKLWVQVMAALAEGVRAAYAEVPAGVADKDLRRLAALIRVRKTAVAMRPCGDGMPPGVAHLRLRAHQVGWKGAEAGHGRLTERRLVLEASGKAMAGMSRRIEVIDDGADVVRVVSGLGAGEGRRAAG